MTLLKFLISKTFFKHLFLASILGSLIIIITISYLKIYTRHGRSLSVPDFDGMSIEQVEKLTNIERLKYEITDSVYLSKKAPGTVISQNPRAGFRVKKYRTIHLIINAISPKKVDMPKVTDISLRAAKAELEMSDLKLGKIIFEPSHYHNLVIEQKLNGKIIKPYQKVIAGSKIDLVVGKGWSNELTRTPDLIGRSLDEAENKIADAFLNRGIVDFDRNIKTAGDSTKAFIYYQSPKDDIQTTRGSFIDIKLTIDSLKLPKKEVDDEDK